MGWPRPTRTSWVTELVCINREVFLRFYRLISKTAGIGDIDKYLMSGTGELQSCGRAT